MEEKESLSSDDDDLDEYLKDAAELVMSPLANFSNRTEMTCVGNLVENVQVQDDDLRPARDKAKETFTQKAARKALDRQEKEKRCKHRRLNQQIDLAREERRFSRGSRRIVPARTNLYQTILTVYPYDSDNRTFGLVRWFVPRISCYRIAAPLSCRLLYCFSK